MPAVTVFVSAVTLAEILYGVALVSDRTESGGRGWHGPVRTAFETDFRGRILTFDSEAAEALAALAAGQAGRFHGRTPRSLQSRVTDRGVAG